MNISENAVSLLAARSYRGVGPGWINEHLADRPAAEEIVRRLAAKAPDATGADFAVRCAQVRRARPAGATVAAGAERPRDFYVF